MGRRFRKYKNYIISLLMLIMLAVSIGIYKYDKYLSSVTVIQLYDDTVNITLQDFGTETFGSGTINKEDKLVKVNYFEVASSDKLTLFVPMKCDVEVLVYKDGHKDYKINKIN